MKAFLIFLLLAFGNKLVRDNLPDLNLNRLFHKHIAPWLFIGYLHWLHTMARRAKNPDVKNRLQHRLLTLTVVVVLANSTNTKNIAE
jgi:hypothetical protein